MLLISASRGFISPTSAFLHRVIHSCCGKALPQRNQRHPITDFVHPAWFESLRALNRSHRSGSGCLRLIEIREVQFSLRRWDLSAFGFSSQPPPKRLDRRMRTRHAVEDDIAVIPPFNPHRPASAPDSQRLTTNRPIESAPDKTNSSTEQTSAGALHDWDLAFIRH